MIKTFLLAGLVFQVMAALYPVSVHNQNLQFTGSFPGRPAAGALTDSEDVYQKVKAGKEAAATLCATPLFSTAKLALENASMDGCEHSIAFGKDADDSLITSPMIDGDTSRGRVNTNFQKAFADLHNHDNDQPPSPGDMYTLVKLNNRIEGYHTRFVLAPESTLYALYVYDLALANDFFARYPLELSPGFPPRFPEPIFDEYDRVSIYFEELGESRLVAQERAMAFVLGKYRTGVVLLKLESPGHFAWIQTREFVVNGSKTYVVSDCP